MFTKDERGTFPYWFAHWCAYQMTALNLKVWKPRYLLHDIEKPWLMLLFRGDYPRVQTWHRRHNRHHPEYSKGVERIDYEAMVIDWECSRLTKEASNYGVRQLLFNECHKAVERGMENYEIRYMYRNSIDVIEKWKL